VFLFGIRLHTSNDHFILKFIFLPNVTERVRVRMGEYTEPLKVCGALAILTKEYAEQLQET
jgi:hypothetical protein